MKIPFCIIIIHTKPNRYVEYSPAYDRWELVSDFNRCCFLPKCWAEEFMNTPGLDKRYKLHEITINDPPITRHNT